MNTRSSTSVASAFFRELQHQISGAVRTDRLYRYLYSTDASSYQVEPLGVVLPAGVEDVVKTIQLAAQHQVPIIPRGSGTSLSGQGIGTGLVLDFTRHLDRILEIQPEERWARVEAGVVLDQLNAALKPYGLMVGPDPSSSYAATLGGMAANNSTGSHSIVYGMMLDHVLEVEAVLANGQVVRFGPMDNAAIRQLIRTDSPEARIYQGLLLLMHKYRRAIQTRYPQTWRNVAGYNLNRLLADREAGRPLNLASLLVGSEGTLAAILSLKINLVPRPRTTYLALLHFDRLYTALDMVPSILQHRPSAVELLDRYFIDLTRKNAEYRRRLTFIRGNPAAVLIVEFAGEQVAELAHQASEMLETLRRSGFRGEVVIQDTPDAIANVWQVRKAGLGLLLSKRGDAKPLAFIDDAAVPVERLAEYARQVIAICTEAGTEAAFYAHASAGCLHINPVINLKSERGLQQFKEISRAVIDLAIQMGGTSTGEHGEGLARSYYNERVFGRELHQAFREVKGMFDPENLFNPGKIVDAPQPWDPAILRFHPTYQTPQNPSSTFLDFSRDGGFAGLVEMCNGQGNCRNLLTGVMCPSFKATRDEAHSTRGRANALRAAITARLGPDGFRDPELFKVLDWCLACKACKRECPSIVDMAKLKTEYLAAYYQRVGIPRKARLLGRVHRLYQLGRLFPGLARWVSSGTFTRWVLEKLFDIDRRRSLPVPVGKTFHSWFFSRPSGKSATPRPRVLFWVDTFTNYLEPEIGQAAVAVLEAAGWEVQVLKGNACCGRPAISLGLLAEARSQAEKNVERLWPFVRQGIPIVGVEPGCLTTFRDEYPDLVPGEASQQLARQAFLIDEFLVQQAEAGGVTFSEPLRAPARSVQVHTHCFQKALGSAHFTCKMLQWIPEMAVQEIDSGCCGMAGAFGYDVAHFELSMKIAEDRLFPAIRQATADTIAATGTSCRHQIRDGTGRVAVHPIVLLARALGWTPPERTASKVIEN
ncbi:MAG: FAD-binding protein [Calditrichaeota bacterium]|nr:FAD-binding protein [Calditrichota bacterium]